MTADDGHPVVAFDATNDVLTCHRHHIVHALGESCPACALHWGLMVERFTPPHARRRAALLRAISAASTAADEAQRGNPKGRL